MAGSDRIARSVLELSTDSGSFKSDLQDIEKRIGSLGSSFAGLGKQLSSIGDRVSSVGKGLSVALSAPLAAVGAAALAAGVDLDEAFDAIRIGTGATGDALEGLQASFATVFKQVPNSAGEVSKAIADLNTTLGLTGKPLEGLATQVLTLARITKSDLNQVLPDTTRLFGDWKVATADQGRTLDYVFKTSQATGASITDLMEKATRSGAAFRALGFTLEQSVAMLGTWQKEGLDSETMLSGLDIAARKFAQSNIPLADGLRSVVQRMQELGPGTRSAALATEVFGRSATMMAEAIFKGQLNVDEMVKSLKASKETIGSAAADTDGFAEAWSSLKNNLELALNPLGGTLVSILDNLKPKMQALGDLANALGKYFAALSPSAQLAVIGIGALVAISGPAIVALGTIIKNARELGSVLSLVATGYGALAPQIATVGTRLAELSGPLGLVGSGMSALPTTIGGLGTALGGLLPILASVATGFLIAKSQLDEWRASQEQAAAKLQQQADLLEAYRKVTGETGAVLLDFTRLTKDQQQQLVAMAKATQDARLKADTLGLSLNTAKDGMKSAGQSAAQLAANLGALTKKTAEEKQAEADWRKQAEEDYKAVVKANEDLIKSIRDFNDSVHKGEGTRAAFSDWLKSLPDATLKLRDAITPAMIAQAQLNEALADGFRNQAEMEAETRQTITTLGKWHNALATVSQGFQQVAQIAGGAMAEVARAIGTGVASADQLVDGLDRVKHSLNDQNLQKPGIQVDFSGILTGFASIVGALASLGQLVHDAFTTPEWQKVMRDIGAAWGVQISQSLAQQIATDENAVLMAAGHTGGLAGKKAGMEFLKAAGFSARQVAELFNLDKIIQESGGLTGQNLDQWIARADDLFRVVQLGGLNGAKATKELSDLIAEFGAQANATDGVWSAAFQDLLAQAKALGVGLDQINTLISGQIDKLGTGTRGLTAGLKGAYENDFKTLTGMTVEEADKAVEELKDLQAQATDDLSDADRRRMDELTATVATITAANATIRENTQTEFNRVTGIVLDSFNTMRAQGKSIPEAVSQLGPAIGDLMEEAKRFGFEGTDAFNQLARWQTLVTANQPLLDQLNGLNQLAVAQANLNGLTADSYERLQQQGVSTYQQLLDAGFTQNEALQAAAPLLQTIIDLHEKSGLAIDDETQQLIDQAKAAGDLGETQESAQERSAKSLEHVASTLDLLAEKFGVVLPKAADDMATQIGQRVGDLATDINDTLGGLSFDIPVNFVQGDTRVVQEGPNAGQFSADPLPGPPDGGFAKGTPRLDFMHFARRGERRTLHDDEAVIPRGSGHQLASEIAAAMGGMAPRVAAGPSEVALYIDSRRFASAVMPGMARYWENSQATRVR